MDGFYGGMKVWRGNCVWHYWEIRICGHHGVSFSSQCQNSNVKTCLSLPVKGGIWNGVLAASEWQALSKAHCVRVKGCQIWYLPFVSRFSVWVSPMTRHLDREKGKEKQNLQEYHIWSDFPLGAKERIGGHTSKDGLLCISLLVTVETGQEREVGHITSFLTQVRAKTRNWRGESRDLCEEPEDTLVFVCHTVTQLDITARKVTTDNANGA